MTDILHLIGATHSGGAEQFVSNLAVEQQTAHGLEVAVHALSSKVDAVGKEQRKRLSDAGVRVSSGPTEKIRWRSVLAYREVLRNRVPRLVHLHTPNTVHAHALASILGVRMDPVARTFHSTNGQASLASKFAHQILNSRLLVACSASVKAIVDGEYNRRVDVINNGIKWKSPVRTPLMAIQAKRELGLDETLTHFLCVGMFRGEDLSKSAKAQDVLIKAARLIQGRNRKFVVHFLGGGPLLDAARHLGAESPVLNFVGISGNVDDWLLAADVLVMPSRWEGLPLTLLEACGLGLPAVTSNIPALRDFSLSEHMRFPVDDVDSLATLMLRLMEGRGQENDEAEESAQRFRATYSIQQCCQNYLAAYKRVGLL